MKKFILGVAAACLLSFNVWAEDGLLKTGHPDEYTVKKGDTLWDISSTFLNSPWKWPEVWHANPQIENPHLIYPGDLIKLVYIDGEAKLTSERTLKLTPGGGSSGASGTEKLGPSIHVIEGQKAITAIPLDRIDAFLSKSRVVTDKELEKAPYMVAGPQSRIIVGKGDAGYARGEFTGNISNYGVYRREKVFVDPFTGETLGVNALGLGSVSLKSLQGDIATLEVLSAREDIRMGDRLLPGEENPINSTFYPKSPDKELKGAVIMAVEGGVTQVGKFNVIMINRGEREGLMAGDVVAIFKKGETVVDRVQGGKVKLPDEKAGTAMVFRAFKKMSFALVMEADRPLAVGDLLRNP